MYINLYHIQPIGQEFMDGLIKGAQPDSKRVEQDQQPLEQRPRLPGTRCPV